MKETLDQTSRTALVKYRLDRAAEPIEEARAFINAIRELIKLG